VWASNHHSHYTHHSQTSCDSSCTKESNHCHTTNLSLNHSEFHLQNGCHSCTAIFLWLHSGVWKPTCQLYALSHDHMIFWWGIVCGKPTSPTYGGICHSVTKLITSKCHRCLPNTCLRSDYAYIICGNKLVSPTVSWQVMKVWDNVWGGLPNIILFVPEVREQHFQAGPVWVSCWDNEICPNWYLLLNIKGPHLHLSLC